MILFLSIKFTFMATIMRHIANVLFCNNHYNTLTYKVFEKESKKYLDSKSHLSNAMKNALFQAATDVISII